MTLRPNCSKAVQVTIARFHRCHYIAPPFCQPWLGLAPATPVVKVRPGQQAFLSGSAAYLPTALLVRHNWQRSRRAARRDIRPINCGIALSIRSIAYSARSRPGACSNWPELTPYASDAMSAGVSLTLDC
jgi:hypothetical protein